MIATAKDLRFHSKKLLDSTSRGEEVIITFRGKPVAKLIPLTKPKTKQKSDDELFGIWEDNNESLNVNEYVNDLRKSRQHAG